jgi:Fe-S cluster assembly scaffold protein SufB
MEKMNMRVNLLPAFTYNWLHMNDAVVENVEVENEQEILAEVPAEIKDERTERPVYQEIETGSGADMDRLVQNAGIGARVFTASAGTKITNDAVRLHFDYQDGAAGKLNMIGLNLEKDSEMTVVMDYQSGADAKGLAGVQTKISAGENSLLHLIQIHRLGDGFTFLNDIGGVCAEDAGIEVIHVILSGKAIYEGCRVALRGDKSTLGVEVGYQVAGDARLDMNYDAYHTGKKTSCEMNASGVLRDRAFKLFRGTIDFQNGCSGSTGDEMEDVLLMDDGVVNQTIPLILCAEEDVVGNHGATIGRLDEDLMFYLESRGMNDDEIYEMMAKARIESVIRKIPDQKTVDLLITKDEEKEA